MAATIASDCRMEANLRALQRLDPNIVELMISATHVVLYEFSNAKRTWEKKNVEGSFFLTKRSDVPQFKLIVLNRNSTHNLELPLTATFQLQVKDPYVIFRDCAASKGTDEIRGLWFHDGKERDSVASYIEKVVKTLVQIKETEKNNSTENDKGSDEKWTAAKRHCGTSDDVGTAMLASLTMSNDSQPTLTDTSKRKNSSSNSAAVDNNIILDKKSLQLSLLSLIHDEQFLDLIHSQYLKVINARAQRQEQTRPKESDS